MLMLIHSLLNLFYPIADTLVVGSYTQQGNPGIELIDTKSKRVIDTLQVPQASFQYLSADGTSLFSVSERAGNAGALYSFQKNYLGKWEKLSQQATEGDAPCHINFRKKSGTIYTANYMGGNVSIFKTTKGIISPLSQKLEYIGQGKYPQQAKSHAHMIMFSHGEDQMHVADLGTDKIYHYVVRPDGLVETNYQFTQFPSGTGPRHFVFSPDEKMVYVVGELSGTVDVFTVGPTKWNHIQREVIDFSKKDGAKASADIHISPDGKWLVASNRLSQNSLVVFRIEPSGNIQFKHEILVGKTPRNFQFNQTGTIIFVACKDDNRIQQYSFNQETGTLVDLQNDIQVKNPVAILAVGLPK